MTNLFPAAELENHFPSVRRSSSLVLACRWTRLPPVPLPSIATFLAVAARVQGTIDFAEAAR
jgi:hypothetical protein